VIESNEANPVAVSYRGARKRRRAIDRMVEFGSAVNVRTHQASRVQRDKDRMAAFGLILANLQASVSRAGPPIDMARVVAGHILAQRLELPAFAAEPARFDPEFVTQR